ncbi:MAG: FtsQ-type POTRA domain-containing protein [Actinobacteria bacterium]|nr:FtsQ-type POTRA domain-containing protein [Actinomycetota bacterium]
MRRADRTRRPRSGRSRRLLVAAIVATVAAAGFASSRSSWFHVRRIEVSGAGHLSRAEVLEIAGISRSSNAVWLDEGSAERRLLSHAWVAEADVHVVLPVTVRVAVVERTAIAVASDGMREVLLSGDGSSLAVGATAGPRPGTPRGLPLIELLVARSVDGAAPNPVGAARALGAMSPELRDRVKSVSVQLDGTLVLTLRAGPTVWFGTPTQIAAKARAIERMLVWEETEGERILRLTVEAPASPAATLAG